jgi:hypothetical protein
MDPVIMNGMWVAIEALEANEALLLMKIADFPDMKDKSRQQLHRKLYTKANPGMVHTVDLRTAIKRVNEG